MFCPQSQHAAVRGARVSEPSPGPQGSEETVEDTALKRTAVHRPGGGPSLHQEPNCWHLDLGLPRLLNCEKSISVA